MKRTILTALPIAALVLAGCSGNGDETATDGGQNGDTAATQEEPDAPRTVDPAAEPTNADQGEVEVTSCEKDDNDRVVMEADITNSTEETRTYILTGVATNAGGEVLGSAAIMVDDIEAGQTASGSGTTNEPIEDDIECSIQQIDSMPVG